VDDLKGLLGEELFSQLTAKLGDKKLLIDDGKMIPKHRFDEVSDSLKTQKELNKTYEDQVKQLKESVSGNADLTKQIGDLQKQIKEQQSTSDAKVTKATKTFAVKEALLNEGVADIEARELLSLRFDIEKIELDESGKVKGFSEMVKPLKENSTLKNLFGQTKMSGQEHEKGDNPAFGEFAGDKNPFSKKGFNLTKQIEITKSDPKLASQLKQSAQK